MWAQRLIRAVLLAPAFTARAGDKTLLIELEPRSAALPAGGAGAMPVFLQLADIALAFRVGAPGACAIRIAGCVCMANSKMLRKLTIRHAQAKP
jgi:hypothetical protein